MPNELKNAEHLTPIRLTMKSSYRLTRRPTWRSYYVAYNFSISLDVYIADNVSQIGMNLKAINRCI